MSSHFYETPGPSVDEPTDFDKWFRDREVMAKLAFRGKVFLDDSNVIWDEIDNTRKNIARNSSSRAMVPVVGKIARAYSYSQPVRRLHAWVLECQAYKSLDEAEEIRARLFEN